MEKFRIIISVRVADSISAMYRNSKRIETIAKLLLTIGILIVSVNAQNASYKPVVAIANDVLRTNPISTSSGVKEVTIGDRLRVIPAPGVPGWYYGHPDGIAIYGFIHGNSIRFVNKTTPRRTPNQTKVDSVFMPNGEGLILVPIADPFTQKPSVLKAPAKRAPANFCSPPLYCPDIGDVYETLEANTGKLQKGKFEKSSEWENRKKSLLDDVVLPGGNKASDQMIFLFEEGTGVPEARPASYDADNERWTFPLDILRFSGSICLPMMSERTGHLYCLIVPKSIGSNRNAFVQMAPNIASTNDGKLQISFVGKIVEPHIWNAEPSNTNSIFMGLHFEVSDVICLNPKSGQRWKVEFESSKPIVPRQSSTDDREMLPTFSSDRIMPPTLDEIRGLVQSTLLKVSIGLEKDDFTDFREQFSKYRKSNTSEAQVKYDFDTLTQEKSTIVLLRSSLNQTVLFDGSPKIEKSGNLELLRVLGGYSVNSSKVIRFYLTYIWEDGAWKVFFYHITKN